jgi:hypothetical protein
VVVNWFKPEFKFDWPKSQSHMLKLIRAGIAWTSTFHQTTFIFTHQFFITTTRHVDHT